MTLALSTFAIVDAPGFLAVADTEQRRGVEGALEAAVVSLRAAQVPGQLLAGQARVLPFGGLDSGFGEPVGADDVAVAQSGLQPLDADPANSRGGLIAGQQGERAGCW